MKGVTILQQLKPKVNSLINDLIEEITPVIKKAISNFLNLGKEILEENAGNMVDTSKGKIQNKLNVNKGDVKNENDK